MSEANDALRHTPPVRWLLLALWLGCVLWLRTVIPIASLESEGAAFAVWSRVGLPVAALTWLWAYRTRLRSRAALSPLVLAGGVWAALLLVAAGHGLAYELRDAYFLRQPVRLALLSGVGMLFLVFPPAVAVGGLFFVLTDRRPGDAADRTPGAAGHRRPGSEDAADRTPEAADA